MFGAVTFGGIAFGQSVSEPPVGFGDDPSYAFILNGATTQRIRFPDLSIHDTIGAQPNTAALTFDGVEPAVGASIAIVFRSPDNRLFGGQVQHLTRTYESKPTERLTCFPADLIDHTFALNKRRPVGAFLDVSATTIAQQLVATYAPGFTTVQVEAGLPTVRINFDGSESLVEALNRLGQMVGARLKVDYARDVRLYRTYMLPPPIPLTPSTPPLDAPPIQFATDLSQVRTRVYGKGHGERVLADVLAGDTILPIADAVMFPTSGQAIVALVPDDAQTQIVAYSSVHPGGGGTLVGPGYAPAVAPTAQLVPGAGLPLGTYQYAYTYGTATGECTPSPLAIVVSGIMSPPAAAPILGPPTLGAGPEPGAHQYAYTDVTATGETLPGPVQAVTIPVLGPPGAAPTLGTPTAIGAGPEAGVHQYAYSDVTASGETVPGPIRSITIGQLPPPSTAPMCAGAGTGNYGNGILYEFAVTFVTAAGETTLGPIGSIIFPGAETDPPSTWHQIQISAIPVGPSGVTARKLYRRDFGVWVIVNTGTTLANNTTSSYLSYGQEATSGSAPPSNTAGIVNQVPISAIAAGPAGTTARRLYRTGAGSAQLRLLATLNDNTTTTYTDTTPDAALGANAPTVGTAANYQTVAVSAIAVGPAGTTARKLYRTAAGASQLKLLATIADNATTTYSDTTPDASLGANAPTSGTALAQVVTLSGVATGPSGTLRRRIYRTAVNGSQLKLLWTDTTFENNTFTGPHIDAQADAGLGANAPTSDTSGLTPPGGGFVPPGSTSMLTASAAPFAAGGGWATSSQQVIRYTGIAADGITLIGIPASGPGAITTAIVFGSQLLPSPALVGVTGMVRGVLKGGAVHIWVQRDDTAAQAALGLLERDPTGNPTDGIREYLISDERRGAPSLIDLCDAELARFARPIIDVTYATHDIQSHAGATVHIDLGWGFVGDFLIQDVTITIEEAPQLPPRYAVHASSLKFTFVDLLQRVLLGQ